MNELIPIMESEGKRTVNARDLHEFVGSSQQFADWIKNRIEKYGFEEGSDFVRLHKKMKANNATLIEYHLSIDMAKQLTMVENNEKGREARRYFIACENALKTAKSSLKSIKAESAKARTGIAAEWQRHGANAPKHFINLTYAEYKVLGYEKPREVKKGAMASVELTRLFALESLERLKLEIMPEINGYYELRDSITATGTLLDGMMERMVLEHRKPRGVVS